MSQNYNLAETVVEYREFEGRPALPRCPGLGRGCRLRALVGRCAPAVGRTDDLRGNQVARRRRSPAPRPPCTARGVAAAQLPPPCTRSFRAGLRQR
jgi:hypothetical protein